MDRVQPGLRKDRLGAGRLINRLMQLSKLETMRTWPRVADINARELITFCWESGREGNTGEGRSLNKGLVLGSNSGREGGSLDSKQETLPRDPRDKQ